jgi:hypothetical protein
MTASNSDLPRLIEQVANIINETEKNKLVSTFREKFGLVSLDEQGIKELVDQFEEELGNILGQERESDVSSAVKNFEAILKNPSLKSLNDFGDQLEELFQQLLKEKLQAFSQALHDIQPNQQHTNSESIKIIYHYITQDLAESNSKEIKNNIKIIEEKWALLDDTADNIIEANRKGFLALLIKGVKQSANESVANLLIEKAVKHFKRESGVILSALLDRAESPAQAVRSATKFLSEDLERSKSDLQDKNVVLEEQNALLEESEKANNALKEKLTRQEQQLARLQEQLAQRDEEKEQEKLITLSPPKKSSLKISPELADLKKENESLQEDISLLKINTTDVQEKNKFLEKRIALLEKINSHEKQKNIEITQALAIQQAVQKSPATTPVLPDQEEIFEFLQDTEKHKQEDKQPAKEQSTDAELTEEDEPESLTNSDKVQALKDQVLGKEKQIQELKTNLLKEQHAKDMVQLRADCLRTINQWQELPEYKKPKKQIKELAIIYNKLGKGQSVDSLKELFHQTSKSIMFGNRIISAAFNDEILKKKEEKTFSEVEIKEIMNAIFTMTQMKERNWKVDYREDKIIKPENKQDGLIENFTVPLTVSKASGFWKKVEEVSLEFSKDKGKITVKCMTKAPKPIQGLVTDLQNAFNKPSGSVKIGRKP